MFAPASTNGRDDHGLVGARVYLERAEHGLVPHQRRVAVDQRDHHGVGVDEGVAEHELGHAHGILGALRRGHRAHERFVGMLERAVGDVQMALGDRDVDRLAHHRSGIVHRRRQIGELVELVQVGERAIAPLVVEVIHERRAVSRRERHLVAADLGAALGIARVHHEMARVSGNQRHEQLARDAHPIALDLGAGRAPHPARLVVAEIDPDLLEDVERRPMDQLEALGIQDLVHRDGALQDRQPAALRPGPRLAPGGSAAASSLSRCGRHGGPHCSPGARAPSARRADHRRFARLAPWQLRSRSRDFRPA